MTWNWKQINLSWYDLLRDTNQKLTKTTQAENMFSANNSRSKQMITNGQKLSEIAVTTSLSRKFSIDLTAISRRTNYLNTNNSVTKIQFDYYTLPRIHVVREIIKCIMIAGMCVSCQFWCGMRMLDLCVWLSK